MIFASLIDRWRSLRYYVIADPADNSVTLSKRLFLHMRKEAEKAGDDGDATSVFVFRIPRHATFGFMLNPEIDGPTQLCQIQHNSKYRCIGFETLCPSVGRVFFEYGLPATRPAKLSVSVRRTPQGKTYYQFDAPNKKLVRLCKAYSETRGKRT